MMLSHHNGPLKELKAEHTRFTNHHGNMNNDSAGVKAQQHFIIFGITLFVAFLNSLAWRH